MPAWVQRILCCWRARQRRIDRYYLFHAIRGQQQTWDQGTRAILAHIEHDAAWRHREEWEGHEEIE